METHRKPYKDSSNIYKSNIPVNVDWICESNPSGYPIPHTRIKSEPIPIIGSPYQSNLKKIEKKNHY